METLSIAQPVITADELLTQPATYNGAPALDLLTDDEGASGCRLYLARNDMHAPRLISGDYLVARPLAREQWAHICADSFALLLVQYAADEEDESWPAFQAHHVARIVGNGLRYGGSLLSLHDDDASLPEPVETAAADLVEVYQITRTIRPL